MCSPGLLYDTIIGYIAVHCIHSYDNIFYNLISSIISFRVAAVSPLHSS